MTNREQQEKIFRAIGFVGDDLIQRADAPVERRSIHTAWVKWAALAACCVLVIGLAAKLPLFQMKSASQAPEATSMNASAEGPEMKEELAEDTVTTEAAPAEAEEAPAEEKLQTGEMGASSGNDTAERIGTPYDAALKNTLLETTVGPVTLGMPASDVLSLLGEPLEKSDGYYVCTDKGEYFYAAWRYNFTNDPDVLDVILQMADVGNGLVLNEIMTFGTSDWALPDGVKNGSTAEEAIAAYPDAQLQYNGVDGSLSAIVLEAGHVHLHILIENDVVTNITLGTYYEDPGWSDETSYEEPVYSFASSDIVVYQKASDGWISYHMKDKAAKKLEVVLGIEDLVPIGQAPEPRYYLDFQNGTVVMLGEDRLSGAVYTCEDLSSFRAAMEKGEDPAPYLTCLTVCTFPAGTDEAVQELTLESAASKD